MPAEPCLGAVYCLSLLLFALLVWLPGCVGTVKLEPTKGTTELTSDMRSPTD